MVADTVLLPRISMTPKLPFKFLWATLLIALIWFIIMFMYIDDLTKDEAKDVHIHNSKIKVNIDSATRVRSKGKDKLRKGREYKATRYLAKERIAAIDYQDDEEEEQEYQPNINYSKGANLEYIDDDDVAKYVLTEKTGVKYHAKRVPKRISLRPVRRKVVYVTDSKSSSETRRLDANHNLVWQGNSKVLHSVNINSKDSVKTLGVDNSTKWYVGKNIVPKQAVIQDHSNIMAQVNSKIRKMEQTYKVPENVLALEGQAKEYLSFKNNVKDSANINVHRHINVPPSENKQPEKKQYTLSEINFPKKSKNYRPHPFRDVDGQSLRHYKYQGGKLPSTQTVFPFHKRHVPVVPMHLSTNHNVSTSGRRGLGKLPVIHPINAERTLTPDDVLDIKDGHGRHSFNVAASEKISLDRSLPVTRPSR